MFNLTKVRISSLIIGLLLSFLAALAIWNYYVAAFGTSHCSERDQECHDNLATGFERLEKYRSAHGHFPTETDALRMFDNARPKDCVYEWIGGTIRFDNKGILVRCPNHRMSIAGWMLRRPPAYMALLSDGTITLIKKE